MIPHIAIVISGNEKMQFQTELLLRSLSHYGKIEYYCTVFILENDNIKNKYIEDHADLHLPGRSEVQVPLDSQRTVEYRPQV